MSDPHNSSSRRVLVNDNNVDEHIIHDDQLQVAHLDDIFDPFFLEVKGLISGQAAGRGSVYFFNYDGMKLVLRHYHRGGGLFRKY